MKAKILTLSVIALAFVIAGLSGISAKTALAETSVAEQPLCKTVNYSTFGSCISGIKTRTVIDKYPINCALTTFQKESRSEICGQVLGVKIYKPGSLLRSPDGKIYVVLAGQKLKVVHNLEELKTYGNRQVDNVSDALIAQYKQSYGVVLGVKVYANGTLLRGPNYKVYVIQSGKKHYLSGPSELIKYQGQEILNVSAQVIANYENI